MPLVENTDLSGAWNYRVYTIDTPHTDLGVCGRVKELWQSKRRGGALPAWRDFQFNDLQPWYGWIAVEDIISRDPYDCTFRLWGTRLVDLMKIEMTGKTFSYGVESGLYSAGERALWGRLSQTPSILIAQDNVDWLEPYIFAAGKRFHDITLPLADDGKTIDKLFSVTIVE